MYLQSDVRLCGAGSRYEPREWQGVKGIGGYISTSNCVVDSLHMLPVMTRREGTHRSAWISQQPRQSAESATPPSWFSAGARGCGPQQVLTGVLSRRRLTSHEMNDADTPGYLPLMYNRAGTTRLPATNEQLRHVGFELVSGGWGPQRVLKGVLSRG